MSVCVRAYVRECVCVCVGVRAYVCVCVHAVGEKEKYVFLKTFQVFVAAWYARNVYHEYIINVISGKY